MGRSLQPLREPYGRAPQCFLVLAIALAGALSLARAQTAKPPAAPTIDAASVRWVCNNRVNCRGLRGPGVIDPVRLSDPSDEMAADVPLAYGMTWAQTEGLPDWTGVDRYQIQIQAASPVSKTQMEQVLLRRVLEQCFSLRASIVRKPAPGYALVVAPGGIKFKRVQKPPPRRVVEGVMTLSSLGQLVALLNRFYYGGLATCQHCGVTRPVSDATGLTGFYNIPFPAPVAMDPATNLLAALRPLGLEVKPAPGTETQLLVQHLDHLRTSCTLGPQPTTPQEH